MFATKLLNLHPALGDLFTRRAAGKLKRMASGFRSRRRIGLTIMAFVLGIIWTGQAVLGVLFRKPADPESLLRWIPLSLAGYVVWNLLKVVFQKTEEPFDWTPAEQEWLLSAPLTRRDLVRYRFKAIVGAAIMKAGIFALVMIPDFHILLLGFTGMLIGLLGIELLRLCAEVFVFGLSPRQRNYLRCLVGVPVAASLLAAGFWAHQQWSAGEFRNLLSLEAVACFSQGLLTLTSLPFIKWALVPLTLLGQTMLSAQFSVSVFATLAVGVVIVLALRECLIQLDQQCQKWPSAREKINWQTALQQNDVQRKNLQSKLPSLRAPARWKGIGTLAWRQWQGVLTYKGSLLVAMSVPFVLALAPAFDEGQNAETGILLVVALLACYSLLLLPAALKFDFRRDIDRINTLKALPFSPTAISVGQLVVPVLLTSLFQFTAIIAAWWIKPFALTLVVGAMGILVPFNLFVFSLENLMFLWYPYRIKGEGVQVLIRSILAFTAKGLIFLGSMFVLGLCHLLSKLATQKLFHGLRFESTLMLTAIFFGGCVLVVSHLLICGIARAFNNIDASRDLAAIS